MTPTTVLSNTFSYMTTATHAHLQYITVPQQGSRQVKRQNGAHGTQYFSGSGPDTLPSPLDHCPVPKPDNKSKISDHEGNRGGV